MNSLKNTLARAEGNPSRRDDLLELVYITVKGKIGKHIELVLDGRTPIQGVLGQVARAGTTFTFHINDEIFIVDSKDIIDIIC
jgi:hypothetical protein